MKRTVFLFIVIAMAGITVWAGFRFGALKWYRPWAYSSSVTNSKNISWAEAVEKVRADRGEPAGGNAPVEVPPELKHYNDRHWFLATQVAEVGKYNVPTCQDFVDLAAMIQRREMVTLPAVTDTYVLYGVGEKADDKPFSRYHELSPQPAVSRDMKSVSRHSRDSGGVDAIEVELYEEAQLKNAYKRLDDKRSTIETEVAALKSQSGGLKKGDREKQKELQKQITEKQRELNSTSEEKARLDRFYGQGERQTKKSPAPDMSGAYSREQLFRDYETLAALAKDFAGRAFNLDAPSDRESMKVAMLSSLRPEALKILEEIASAYHRQFARPLPVSSLVRPEQYQHALRQVNRNAVLIDTPPHSTGLAFDIDYRYMSAAEQTFVMAELARLKTDGRVEVIRERNANYHVFAFVNGTRPADELITASLEAAGAPDPEDGEQESEIKDQKSEIGGRKSEVRAKVKSKSPKHRTAKARTRKRR